MSGVGRGELATSAGDTPPQPSRARKILIRTATGTAIGLSVALLLWVSDRIGSPLPVLLVGALLAAANAIELGLMPVVGAAIGAPAMGGAWLASAGAACAGLAFAGGRGDTALVAAVFGVTVVALVLRPIGASAPRHPSTRWAPVWATLPLPLLAWIHLEHGTRGLVALIVLSKVGDIAGYFVGSACGKTHPFPRLSPGKTTEGCLGSLVAGGAAGALLESLDALPGPDGIKWGITIGLLINLAAQAGDLLESYIKRSAGVKDSSGWMGASGGVLDVTDSLLLTVPVALWIWGLPLG